MSNSYTTRGGLIQPEVGQNLNTWGDLLNNNNFPLIDKGIWGFESITVTGDFSLTRTNGDATSTQLNKGLNLIGAPSADFTVTVLSYENITRVRNATGRNATLKISAGTGVTLATGQIADIGYNANLGDVTLVSPNRFPGDAVFAGAVQVAGKITNLSPGTQGTDGVNLTQLNNAIAAILTAGDGSLLVQATDSTRKFLASALQATSAGGISFTVSGASGANQALMAALDVSSMTALSGSIDAAADKIPIYDASAAAHRYVTPSQVSDEGNNVLLAGVLAV